MTACPGSSSGEGATSARESRRQAVGLMEHPVAVSELLDARLYIGGMERLDRITIEPGKMGGQPCIRGHRFTVEHLLNLVGA
ncbi:MAG: DUF433 domain-containing protein, partial [Streptosporangiaceae bacterium]